MDININENPQTGGWRNISIIKVDALTNCPKILTNANSNQLTYLVSDDTTVNIMPLSDKISLKESKSITPSGSLYSINCTLMVLNQTAELDDYFNEYNNKDVIIVAVKNDRTIKIYGSKLFPLKFIYTYEDGDKHEDGSSIRVQVSGKIPQKPVFG